MIAKSVRHINSTRAFDHLFEKASGRNELIKRDARLEDTLSLIQRVVKETTHQTKAIAQKLKADTTIKTLENIWEFVYRHINYKKDAKGKEQIRSPIRTWHDRFSGVDCDCYTVFISSILTNLNIPHKLRIAKYNKDYFQHIYPIVPYDSSYITLDCVMDNFNSEQPFTQKMDTPMELEYLQGIDEDDFDEFLEEENFEGIFNFRKKKKAAASSSSSSSTKKKGIFKKIVGKGLHVINRVNPSTVLLRNGVLAAMKVNLFKVAERLKWAYVTPEVAQKKGMDMGRYQKLVGVRQRLEKIFHGAGGKPENLKKAILSGKGNANREVAGLGAFDFSTSMPLSELLGEEIYRSENIDDMNGLGELGEPATAAAITAATGVIASISALLKNIGELFPKRAGQEAAASQETELVDESITLPTETSSDAFETYTEDYPTDVVTTSTDNSSLPDGGSANQRTSSDASSSDDPEESFWKKNKKWLKPTLFGVGGLGLSILGYQLLKPKKKKPAAPTNDLSGQPKKKGAAKKKTAQKPAKKKTSKTASKTL